VSSAARRQDTLSLCEYPPLVGRRGQTLYPDNDFVRRRVPDLRSVTAERTRTRAISPRSWPW